MAPAPAAPGPRPTRSLVRELVERGWARAVASDVMPAVPEGELAPAVEVSRTARPEYGDYASNLALRLARPLRRPPLAIAEAIADGIREELARAASSGAPLLDEVAVAPPGFVNLRLSPAYVAAAVDAAVAAGAGYGQVRAERPRRINVEFVSANPTGPLHIGNARGAFVGDLLSRVLAAAGHEVTREYYFNDFGAQVRVLGASVRALRAGEPLPEEAYRGAYVADLAAEVPAEVWARATVPGADAAGIVGVWASERVRAGIEASLDHLGVRFDVWKTEGSLHREGWVEGAIARLRGSGHVYEQDGAVWFRSTAFGDDKDRVIRKSDGAYTYFAADIGYLTEKFSRGFDHLIYIWGADHHGTVARVRNAAEAMGLDREAVQMLLIAWVRFIRDGVEISMSKRSGEFITLDELLAEIGVDAARWFFAARGHTVGIDFDIELAKQQSNENPVYYVQYAHARIASILRKAAEAGLAAAPATGAGVAAAEATGAAVTDGAVAGGEVGGAVEGDEVGLGLAREVLRLPEVLEDAAAAQETQGLTTYATELATAFHAYYRDRRVVDTADPTTSAARLRLVEAVRLALANTLALMGISAPESM